MLRTPRDPTVKDLVLPTASGVNLAPFVFVFINRFGDDETLVRRNTEVDSRAGFVEDRVVIGLEVVTEKRKAKIAAPLERTVASSSVAPKAAHERHHVLLEAGSFLHFPGSEAFRDRGQGLAAEVFGA